MVARANEANRTEPKTSLLVPANLGRAFLTTGRLAYPLDTGTRKVDLADVLTSSRTADDANIFRRGTCVCVCKSIILRMAWRPEESPVGLFYYRRGDVMSV